MSKQPDSHCISCYAYSTDVPHRLCAGLSFTDIQLCFVACSVRFTVSQERLFGHVLAPGASPRADALPNQ